MVGMVGQRRSHPLRDHYKRYLFLVKWRLWASTVMDSGQNMAIQNWLVTYLTQFDRLNYSNRDKKHRFSQRQWVSACWASSCRIHCQQGMSTASLSDILYYRGAHRIFWQSFAEKLASKQNLWRLLDDIKAWINLEESELLFSLNQPSTKQIKNSYDVVVKNVLKVVWINLYSSSWINLYTKIRFFFIKLYKQK